MGFIIFFDINCYNALLPILKHAKISTWVIVCRVCEVYSTMGISWSKTHRQVPDRPQNLEQDNRVINHVRP